MGQNKSKVSNVNEQTYINKSQIDVLNHSITNQIANSQVNQAANCGAGLVQSQNISFDNFHSDGDITISDILQGQVGTLSFSCRNNQEVRTEIANQLYQEMMNSLRESNSTNIMAELEAEAKAKLESGFASWGGGTSNSDVDNSINWTVTSEPYQEIKTVIENTIENNFTANNLSECNSNLMQDQNISFSNFSTSNEGTIGIFGIKQNQGGDVYAQCIQNQGISQEMTSIITNVLGVKVENDNTNISDSIQKGYATSETINNGPFESAGKMFGSILDGIGGIFGDLQSASLMCVVLIVILVCCASCFVIVYFFMSEKGYAPKPQELANAASTVISSTKPFGI
jgi:hypothetical protein